MSFSSFLKHLQESLKLKRWLLAGPTVKNVLRIAVCGGAGGDFIKTAAESADIYITGDIKHHQALEAEAYGLPLVDAGHCGTEKCFIDCVKAWAKKKLPDIEWIFDEEIEDPLRCPLQFL